VVFNVNLNKQERLRYLYFAISPTSAIVKANVTDYDESEFQVETGDAQFTLDNYPVAY
jgi:hypothetical protein